MRPAVSTALAAIMLALAVGAGVALDVVAPTPERTEVAAAGRAPESGAWYCAVGDTAEGDTMRLVTAVPAGATTSSAVRVDTFGGGTIDRGGEVEVLPGRVSDQAVVEGRESVGVAARWWDTPTAVSRTWVRQQAGEPAGVVEGPCETDPSNVWYLPGVTTVGGAQARIVVANPFETDAALSVDLVTPEGVETPELLKNIAVSARTTETIELNRYAPEESDLGAVLRVRAGRVVAEAWQSVDPAVGGIQGVSLVELAAVPATTWTVPWFPGSGADSWIWVLNSSERAASVTLTIHTGAGGSPPDGLEEVTIPPGSVRRVDLRGTVPDDVPGGAFTVTSANGVPVTVSGATQLTSDRSERTGIAFQLGQPVADPAWIIASGRSGERRVILHLTNPTADVARVDVSLATAAGPVTPDDATATPVAPGASVDLDLTDHLPDSGPYVVHVRTTEGAVVPGLQSYDLAGRLFLAAQSGTPSRVWAAASEVPVVMFEPVLPQRVGTVLGPAATSPEPTGPPTLPAEDVPVSPLPAPTPS